MTEQLLPEPLLCAQAAIAPFFASSVIEVKSATEPYAIECLGLDGARQIAEAVALGHDVFVINGQHICGGKAVTIVRGSALCAAHAMAEHLGLARP